MKRPRPTNFASLGMALAALMLLPACQGERPDETLVATIYNGDFSLARTHMLNVMGKESDRSDRNFMLNRMRMLLVSLADGYPRSADVAADQLFETLTTQGLNKDKTVASVVLNEDLKIWKGEPFEQALAFHYLGLYHAMQGSWDNARAAITNSMFHLKNFGNDKDGQPLDTQDLTNRAVSLDQQDKGRADAYLESGYQAVESNFLLGYLMTGVANLGIARQTGDPGQMDEAREMMAKVLALDPTMRPLVDQLLAGGYNTILVVDFGRGPQKIGTGPDNAIAKFIPMTASDNRRLIVNAAGASMAYPMVCDVNRMAQDHKWNNLEDVRVAKSVVGDALITAAAVTAVANQGRSEAATYAALGMLLAGAVSKAGAHADTRHCELLPQRVYVVPVTINGPGDRVDLQIEGVADARLILTGMHPPESPRHTALHYVRLVKNGFTGDWKTTGQVLYSNDVTGPAPGLNLPFILGGNCVRKPTLELLQAYRQAGLPPEITLDELEDFYRLEGIQTDANNEYAKLGRHLLEGGKHIVPPQPGTTGFVRIFGRPHPPYQPKDTRVRELAQRIARLKQTTAAAAR